MCGIIYIEKKKSKTDIYQLLKNAYDYQKARGSEGFGYVLLYNDLTIKYNRDTGEKIFENLKTDIKEKDTKAIFFHHRYPTSTPNIKEASHPIKIKRKDKTYYVIHNGIISNDDDLQKIHSQKGLAYSTEIYKVYKTSERTITKEYYYNDSETVAYDFVLYIEGLIDKIRAEGSMAIMVLEVDNKSQKATSLYYFRNNQNPLKVEKHNNYLKISSESKRGNEIATKTLYTKDLLTEITTEKFIELYNPTYTYSKYDDYDYYYPPKTKMGFNVGYDEMIGDEIADYYSELSDDDLQEKIIELENIDKTWRQIPPILEDEYEEQQYNKLELNIAKTEYENRKMPF